MAGNLDQQLTAAQFKIDDLLRLVQTGRVRVPRFQRGLRWDINDVTRLFDSIYRGFPIGTLLFWLRPAPQQAVTLGPLQVSAPAVEEAYWVVDGQQRVTSLAAALLPLPPNTPAPAFDVRFDLENEAFVPSRWELSDLFLPIRQAHDLQRVLAWVRERQLSGPLQERAFRLADRLRNYEIPTYLVRANDEKTLQLIFDRTNTFGKSMRRAEVFQALHATEHGRADDTLTLAGRVSDLGFGHIRDSLLLYCVLSVRSPDVTRDFRSELANDERRAETFQQAYDAIARAIAFMRHELDVPHFDLVPYQHQLVGLVRFFGLFPAPAGQERALLRRWFWQAAEVGPIAKLGATGTLRATAAAVSNDGPYPSVCRLLALTPSGPGAIRLGTYRWTSADTRIAVCALASRRPLDLLTGAVLDVAEVISASGRDALIPVVRESSRRASTLANRVFAPASREETDDEYLDRVRSGDEAQLASLLLTPEMVAALGQSPELFLQIRERELAHFVEAFLRARMDRDLGVRPPIAVLAGDD